MLACRAQFDWANGRSGVIETKDGVLHATLFGPSNDWLMDEGEVLWRGSSERLSRIVEMLQIEAERKDEVQS
jgi:hypothetical protein